MKLSYHKGKNFGDAINPIIFNHYLPDFFDNNDSALFIGIGSILGLKKLARNQQALVFSSGYAAGADSTYGSIPQITPQYHIKCVRGPLTAELLGIDKSLAITDGAILLAAMPQFNKHTNKQWQVSYLPHVGSLAFFDWEGLCNEIGIHFIDPRKDPLIVINEIKSSEKIIAEAMHGAIVADTFRIPWISVKGYSTINEFKWKDWSMSMKLEYKPFLLTSLFSKNFSFGIIKNKVGNSLLAGIFNNAYQLYHKKFKVKKVKRNLLNLCNTNHYNITDESVFQEKLKQMLTILNSLKTNNDD